jgi:hypothetical protein
MNADGRYTETDQEMDANRAWERADVLFKGNERAVDLPASEDYARNHDYQYLDTKYAFDRNGLAAPLHNMSVFECIGCGRQAHSPMEPGLCPTPAFQVAAK